MSAPNIADLATALVISTGTGTATVETGKGTLYPAVPFEAIGHPANSLPEVSNSKLVIVTNVTGDVLTYTDDPSFPSSNTIQAGWRISNYVASKHVRGAYTTKVDKTGDTMTGKLAINSSAADQSIAITPAGNAGNSSSSGGAVNISNTANDGSALVIYTNNTSGSGHLTQVRSNQDSFTQHAIFVDYRGTTNAINVVRRSPTSPSASASAVNISSDNENGSSVQIRGKEKSLGSIKVTHENPSASSASYDASASALSVDIVENTGAPGIGTAAQGIYVDSTTGTTGKLLRIRNLGTDKFSVDKDGIYAHSNKISNVADGVATTDAATVSQVNGKASVGSTVPIASSATAPTAGVATTAARSDHAHPRYDYQPADNNLLAWAYDPILVTTGTIFAAAGTLYMIKIHSPSAISATNIFLYLQTSGATLTASQCYAGIYQNGNLLGTSADLSGSVSPGFASAAGLKTIPIVAGPIAVAAGDFYIAFYANGTTLPTLGRAGSFPTLNNVGLTAGSYRTASANTGLTTALPGTMGTQTSLNVAYWAAVS